MPPAASGVRSKSPSSVKIRIRYSRTRVPSFGGIRLMRNCPGARPAAGPTDTRGGTWVGTYGLQSPTTDPLGTLSPSS